ncbi:MAG: stage V sporulation protein E [Phycisphaerae bacterium]|nr:stage V sporulation protein E [Phycisphaerae bacterium]
MIRPVQALILIVTGLLVLGVVAVHSAGLSVSGSGLATFQELALGKTTMLAALAMVGLFAGMMIPIRSFGPPANRWLPMTLISISILLLILVQLPWIGREVHGARRWIDIGPIGFQPSEVAKWCLVLFLAWHIVANRDRIGEFWKGFVPATGLILLIGGLIGVEDLGTAIVVVLVGMIMLVAGGCKLRHALMPLPVAAVGIAAALISSPYRIDRIRAFMDPYADAQGTGYHVLQSMSAISGGGLVGRGLGNGVQKFGYLPEDTTDFLFSIICEELGIVGCLLVMALYMALMLVGLKILNNTVNAFERLLVFGVLVTISIQALVNLAVVTGLAPTKGIALPLLSSGGTGWILMAFFIGLLGAIDRGNQRLQPDLASGTAIPA